MNKKTIYFIEGRTGCTCCRGENFEEGPYLSKEHPESIVVDWSSGKGNPLASQYSKYGQYRVLTSEGKEIGDGRFIVGDEVWGPEIERRNNE